MNTQHFSAAGRTIVRSLTLLFLVLTGLTLASGWAQAQDSPDATDVTGTMIQEAGSPISEIEVTAHEEESLFPLPAPAISADRQGSSADCTDFRTDRLDISPDGRYVVYRVYNVFADIVPALYSFSTADGSATKLGGASESDYFRFTISPDSQYVVFFNWEDGLRSVPIGGGAPFKLSSVGSDVKISPDSNWVVYKDLGYLYIVPITGGTSLQLLTVKDHDVEYTISPDSKYLVYRTDKISQNKDELYSVLIGGDAATKLSGELPTGGWRVSADSAHVVYSVVSISNDETHYRAALYSVPITGGTSVLLNGPLVTDGTIQHYEISSDSTHVVYFADQDTDEVNELYSVPITGGTSVLLNGPLVTGGAIYDYEVSSDSTLVVYFADQDTDEVNELYSVPIAGGTPIKLNALLPPNSHVIDRNWTVYDDPFYISKDSRYVVYLAAQTQDHIVELYSVPITGGLPIRLNGTLAANGDVSHFKISVDSQSVVYTADQDVYEQVELYSVPIGGGSAVKLNAPLSTDEDVSLVDDDYLGSVLPFDISADNMHVVYVTKQPSPAQSSYRYNKLYSVNITGDAIPKLLNANQSQNEVYDFAFTPNGGHIIYGSPDGTFSLPIAGGVPAQLVLKCTLFLPLIAH